MKRVGMVIGIRPEWQDSIRPEYVNVTLEQLLGHRSGLDQWMNSNERFAAWNDTSITTNRPPKNVAPSV